MRLPESFPGASRTARDEAFQVFLITTCMGLSFQKIHDALHPVDSVSQRKLPIRWEDYNDFSLLPDIEGSKRGYVVHFALAIVEKGIYLDEVMTPREKLLTAQVWEHVGGDPPPVEDGDGHPLTEGYIQGVYALENLGECNLKRGDISEIYGRLMKNWKYCPISWNCHDLAIQLAHRITERPADNLSLTRRLAALNAGLKISVFHMRLWAVTKVHEAANTVTDFAVASSYRPHLPVPLAPPVSILSVFSGIFQKHVYPRFSAYQSVSALLSSWEQNMIACQALDIGQDLSSTLLDEFRKIMHKEASSYPGLNWWLG